MGKNNHYKAQEFIDAIPGSAGIISTIAKRVGCAWHTAKKYIDTYATVRQAYDDECQNILDLAETKVIEMIGDKDGPMIRYYLSTKGKGRGYTLKTEHEHSGPKGGPIESKDVSDFTSDERIARLVAIFDAARERRDRAAN